MTPPCCTRAWEKATGQSRLRKGFTNHWYWEDDLGPHADTRGRSHRVPAPTSAEWLAEIVEAAHYMAIGHIAKGVSVTWTPRSPMHPMPQVGRAPDLRRALCAALNGTPCERKAA